jgi:hypothetical protein
MVYFGRNYDVNDISTVCINGKHIERVQTFKFLGVYISIDYHGMSMLSTC